MPKDMRKMMDVETIDENCRKFKKLFDQFLEFDDEWEYTGNNGVFEPGHENKTPEPGKAISVNNAHWLRPLNYVEFVRAVGTHFNVNTMLRAECFKQRMVDGLSFFEFNYMPLVPHSCHQYNIPLADPCMHWADLCAQRKERCPCTYRRFFPAVSYLYAAASTSHN